MFLHCNLRTHPRNSSKQILARSLTVLAALLLLVSAAGAQAGGGDAPATLEVGKPVERKLAGAEAHSYHIQLSAGQFLSLVVEQRGIDVMVTLSTPDGQPLAGVDSPNGADGPEPLAWVAEASGLYRLEVRSLEKEAKPGAYEVKILEVRQATPLDRKRLAAETSFAEAEQLRQTGTAESLRAALAKYEESLKLWREVGERATEGAVLNRLGFVNLQIGEMQTALGFFSQALPIFQALGDRHSEALTLNYLGGVNGFLNRTAEALAFYEKALALRRELGERAGEASTLNNIALIYATLDEREKALGYYERSLALSRETGDSALEAKTLNNIGSIYDALGEKRKAIELYEAALALHRSAGDRRSEAGVLTNLGLAYETLGDREKALAFYNLAQPILHEVGDRFGEATVLNNLGTLYGKQGERQKSRELLEKALLLHREVGDRYGEAATLDNLAQIYDVLGDDRKAVDFYNQALALSRAIGSASGEADTLYKLARRELLHNNLAKAREHIEAAIGIVESLRAKIVNQQLRSSYFATVQDYYKFYVDLLMRLHKLRPTEGHDGAALQASERARARALLDLLTEANANIRQGVDPALLGRERELQKKLNVKAQEQMKLLGGPHTEQQAGAIAKEIEALAAEYQQVETQIRQTSPRYAALTQPQPLTLGEIQKQLPDDETLLLEYSLGAERSYLWAVSRGGVTSHELPKQEEIEAAAREVYNLIDAANQAEDAAAQKIVASETVAQRERRIAQSIEQAVARADASLPAAAARLSKMVLGPVAPQLGNKRLVIVGDGALQYVPFSALPDPAATGRAVPPLIVRHEIVTLPSASILAELRKQTEGRRPAAKTVAVLADPVFDDSDERVRPGARADSSGAKPQKPARRVPPGLERSVRAVGLRDGVALFDRLPFTRSEAGRILSLVPASESKHAFDFAANRATATNAALGEYRYIHFATHGILDGEHPELSGIVFSLVDESGRPQDGFLRAHEVYNLKLPAELVVLSACQTGLGKEVKGEGLVGLTRGFMYAGTPRVVVSLWSVSDEATAELMARFYRKMLVEKLPPAKALRAAQVSMLGDKNFASPFYWAAFILQGEWR